jgi:hypothetical protein
MRNRLLRLCVPIIMCAGPVICIASFKLKEETWKDAKNVSENYHMLGAELRLVRLPSKHAYLLLS